MLGDNIKLLRELKNISINELARRCKMSPGYLSDIEKGNKENPSMEKLEVIARELGVTVQQLFKEEIDKIDKIDELEDEMKLLYSRVRNLSPKNRDKLLKMIEIFEDETEE